MAIEKYNDWRSFSSINEGLFRKSGEEKEEKLRKKAARREDNFTQDEVNNKEDEFNVKSFKKSVEAIRALINSLIIDARTREAAGNKKASEYVESFRDYLMRASRLLGEVDYQLKRKGKELDKLEDAELIKGFRSIYSKLKDSVNKSAESYTKDSDKAAIEDISDLEFKEISDFLNKAQVEFKKFEEESAKLALLFQVEATQNLAASPDGKTDGKTGGETVELAEIKIDKAITKASVKGKIDPTVKKVQEIYLDMFSKNPVISETTLYKTAKGFGADGKWGKTTSDVIASLKKGIKSFPDFKDKDLGKINVITQDFLNGLVAFAKAVKGEVKESEEPITSVKTFESFLKNNYSNKIEEDLAADAIRAMTGEDDDDDEDEPDEEEEKPIVVKKKQAAEALIKTASEKVVKKEIKEEDKAAIEKVILDKLEKRMSKKELVKGLSKIKGVTIAKDFDPDKDYYSSLSNNWDPMKKNDKPLATAKGIKFFQNNIAELDYDGLWAYYSPETGYYACIKDRSRSLEFREKITDLINNKGVPKKYRYLTKELVSMFSTFTKDETITKFFKNLTFRSTVTTKAIFRASKYLMKEKGVDLLVELRELAMENEAAKKFYYKNKELLKKLV